jgi:ribosomal protein S18 acetylase RimI-like enzyme
MHIRLFRESDSDEVTVLWKLVFPDDPPHNAPALIIQKKMQYQPELFFVGEVEKRIIGTVLAGYDGHRGWLYSVAVHPDHRRDGFGTSLVQYAESALGNLGCLKVNLQVRSTNEAVASFYRKLGYEIEERISMGKKITPNTSLQPTGSAGG